MRKQIIKIELEEYKEYLLQAAAYQELLGQYNLLAYAYQEKTAAVEKTKVKKIGFMP